MGLQSSQCLSDRSEPRQLQGASRKLEGVVYGWVLGGTFQAGAGGSRPEAYKAD